jgi:hypothetical protein
MERFLANQHVEPALRQSGIDCPADYARILIAERFGQWPWTLDEAPLAEYLRFVAVLNLEGQIKSQLQGLPTDQRVYIEG